MTFFVASLWNSIADKRGKKKIYGTLNLVERALAWMVRRKEGHEIEYACMEILRKDFGSPDRRAILVEIYFWIAR